MNAKIDAKSLAKLKAVAEAIPPQSSPRAAQNLAELKEAVKRLERENQEEK